MFEVVLYAIVSLLLLTPLCALLFKRRRLRACFVCLALPFAPYLFVFLNTLLFSALMPRAEWERIVSTKLPSCQIQTVRCFWLTPTQARVYVVRANTDADGSSTQSGEMLDIGLAPARDLHPDETTETVWTEYGGNAHGNTFPPYPDQDHRLFGR